MNKAIKRLTAVLLVIGMLGMCVPSMAEESASGLNGIMWLGESLSNGKTLQSTETILVDEAALSPLLGILAGGSDEEAIEQNKQMINAIMALVKNVSVRSTICMESMASKLELLLQDGLIASADMITQGEKLYLLTNLLPQYAFSISGQELSDLLGQLPLANISSFMNVPEISAETTEAFQLAISETLATPGVVTQTEDTYEENGIVYTSNVTVNMPATMLLELAADMIEIISKDESFSSYLYSIVSMVNESQGSTAITYDEFIAEAAKAATEARAEADAIAEDFVAVSVVVLGNETDDTLVNVTVANVETVHTVVKVAVTGGTVSVQVGTSSAYVTFDSDYTADGANSGIGMLLTIAQNTDGIALITSPTAETTVGEVVEIGFTFNTVAAVDTENADYAMTLSAQDVNVRIFGEYSATRSPLTFDNKLYIDLSSMLGLPEKAIGIHTSTCEVDPIPAPSIEGMSEINLLTMGEEQITALGEAFNEVGMTTLLTNLMTYLPDEAAPLLTMLMTSAQQ